MTQTTTQSTTELYELTPIDNRKSFYSKCHVVDNGGYARLYSYNTLVAQYRYLTQRMYVFGWYSATTARHINAFLHSFGWSRATKKEMKDWNRWEE